MQDKSDKISLGLNTLLTHRQIKTKSHKVEVFCPKNKSTLALSDI